MGQKIFLINEEAYDDENDDDDDDANDDCENNNHYHLCSNTSLPQVCAVRFRDINAIQDQIFENGCGIVPVPLIGVRYEL